METVREQEGAATFGWVGADVYYARFWGNLSASLGAKHVAHVQDAIASTTTLRYFSDSSELAAYDLIARSNFVRVVLANRKKFSEIVVLNWDGELSASSQAIISAIGGSIALLDNRDEFEARLLQAAPRALQVLRSQEPAWRSDRTRGQQPDPSRAAFAPLCGLEILVVEDQDHTRRALVALLKGLGMTVFSAASVAEGLRLVHRTQPNLILSDLDLPDGNGCEFMKEVRTNLGLDGRALPAIAMSGLDGLEIRERALASGFQAFLAKPFDVEPLAAKLIELVPTRSTI